MPKNEACQEVRDLVESWDKFWCARHRAMTELEIFLDGDRYQNDHGAYVKDRRLAQIRGQETQDTIRHIVAKATEKPRNLTPRPIDREDDASAGEVMTSLVENELSNPWKGFEDKNEAAIHSARQMRLGVVWMDWEKDVGPFGEILFRWVDPRRIRWDPAYEDPHDPMCDALVEEKRLNVKKARKLYKAPWLKPDKECFDQAGQYKLGVPLLRNGAGERLPRAGDVDDDKVTLWFCWYKNDPDYIEKAEGDYAPIEDENKRYMVCLSGCGYRTPTQDQIGNYVPPELQGADASSDPGMQYPEMLPRGCPTCSGDLKRIDAQEQSPQVRSFSQGKRLVIIAPFSPEPEKDKPVYDGGWPVPKARSFPGLFITAYQKPGEPTGPCDVDLMWDQQLASDQLRTIAIQRVYEHRNYWEFPEEGIKNYAGKRFNCRDDDGCIMFRDASQAFQSEVKLHSGTGLDPSWPIAFGAVQQALTQYRGMNDLGPVEERSKAKSGVALQTENAIGEVPVQHFKRRIHRAMSKFVGVLSDYISATYTPERLARVNIEGADMLFSLNMDDFPNYDYVIEDTPDFTGLEAAKKDATDMLISAVQNPAVAPFLDIIAEVNSFPPSVVQKIEKRMAEIQANAQMAAEQAAMMGGPGMGGPPGGPPEMGMEQPPEMAGIPGYASGTMSQPGGPALVGERGPELVHLKENTPVVPFAKMRQLADFLGTFGGFLPKVGFGDVAKMVAPPSPGAPIEPGVMGAVNYAMGQPGVMPIGMTAYHGTPHEFKPVPHNPLGEFDLSKIGTGEGAQAFGHGIYLAENPGVAQGYSRVLGGREFTVKGRKLVSTSGGSSRALDQQSMAEKIAADALDDAFNAQSSAPSNFATHRLRQQKQMYPEQAADIDKAMEIVGDWAESGNVQKMTGRTLHVDLPDEHVAKMLDWDKPLKGQPQIVAAARDLHGASHFGYTLPEWYGLPAQRRAELLAKAGPQDLPLTGQGLYNKLRDDLGSQEAASNWLRERGIPGIKYFDQGSRGAGKGTSNFVLFDPSIAKIIKSE